MSSPSEFLTFYRRMATPATLKRARVLPHRPQPQRAVTYTATRSSSSSSSSSGGNIGSGDIGKDRNHTLDKPERLDVQSDASFAARESKIKDEGGHAVQQKDTRDAKASADRDFPEKPANNANIGFQDERGGKGH